MTSTKEFPYYDVCANGPFYAVWKITEQGAENIGLYKPVDLAAALKKLKHPITTDTQKLADELTECGVAATYKTFE